MAQHSRILFAAAILAAAAGCGKAATEQSNVLRIGVITSLTGPAAAFGQAHKNGYTIAVAELNGRGGVLGRKIELVYYDDRSKPDQAVQGVSKLVDQDRVPIILGAYSSENTRAIVPAVTQRQVPLVMPTATADNVMETGSKWVFRICAGSGSYAAATVVRFRPSRPANSLVGNKRVPSGRYPLRIQAAIVS